MPPVVRTGHQGMNGIENLQTNRMRCPACGTQIRETSNCRRQISSAAGLRLDFVPVPFTQTLTLAPLTSPNAGTPTHRWPS
jgi:hypothetical protein